MRIPRLSTLIRAADWLKSAKPAAPMSKRSFLQLGIMAASALALPRCAEPDNSWTHYELGMDLYHEGYYQDAVQELSLYSESFLAAQDRGNYFDLVSAEKTQYLIGKIYDTKLGQFQAAAESYEIALTCFPDSSKAEDTHFRLGEIYHQELDNFTRAIEQFKLLVKRFPASYHVPQSYANIAAIYELHKEYGLAISQYREMFTLYYNTWHREVAIKCQKKIAELYEKLEDFGQAVVEYKYYLEICEEAANTDQVMHKIATLYDDKLGQYDQAVIAYQAYVDAYPDSALAEDACLKMLKILGEKIHDKEKRLAVCWYYVNTYPDSQKCPFFIELIHSIYLGLGQYQKAIETGRYYIEKYPASFDAKKMQLKIARIYRDQLKDYEQAIKEYFILINNDPKDWWVANIYFEVADVYSNDLQLPYKALEVYSLAINNFPGTGTACEGLYYSAKIYEQEGKLNLAAKIYQILINQFKEKSNEYTGLKEYIVEAQAYLDWYCSQYDCGFLEGVA